MQSLKVLPLKKMHIVRGDGCFVFDSSGKRYLDLQSGYWCNVLGYNNPKFTEPVKSQISKLTNVMSSFSTFEVDNALLEFGKVLPQELNRITLLSSGSEAVDLALKIARAATGRSGVVINELGYYGATSYTFSLSAAGRTAKYLPDPGEVHHLPPPICYKCGHKIEDKCTDFSCLEGLQTLINKNNRNIAAIIYEPICGYGILVPPIGYGRELRKYADELGALLIANEVTTGVAKTGRWFGFQYDEIVPDILVLGKALGNGFPVSAVIATTAVEDRCKDEIRHVQSHQNDALAGEVIRTVLSLIREQELVELVEEKGHYWLKSLKKTARDMPMIVDIRGRGLMFGVEISDEKAQHGPIIQETLLKMGFLTDYHIASRTFRFFPPYIISYEEIDSFCVAFKEALSLHDR